VLAQEPREVVRFPAIADEDELHRVETVFGRQSFGRKAGEALHPEREPPAMLEQIRRTLGEYNFAGQYQQAPAPEGSGMVKAAWFRNYTANERPEKFDRIVQGWDPTTAQDRHGGSKTAAQTSGCRHFADSRSNKVKDRDVPIPDLLGPHRRTKSIDRKIAYRKNG
jgi:hypothetical protein